MKTYIYNILILTFLISFCSCTSDDDMIVENIDSEETLVKIHIGRDDFIDIRFVHEDGTPIEAGECIDPNITYGVAIELRLKNFPNRKTEPIRYTVNGALYNMSFIKNDTLINPIRLEFNENDVQLVEHGQFSDTITLVDQGDFELVE